ncbi:uncharacterized protein [Rutidosis leptorrhynchoides]|uniref:uncharacterized protein n=1 Tax=Rutidosis leptorrhynchoides TaxID=125765 RepID=UPI003A99D6BF
MRLGYYWPSMYRDTRDAIKNCLSCQRHAPQIHVPSHELIPITSSWPFYKWAIDLVGPFPDGRHLVVAVDFFTKWVEAKPLKRITGRQIVEVTNRDIVSGIRGRLDTDRKGWEDELPMVLWAFRTTPKGSNRETPFSLVYCSEAVIPTEIAVSTQRVTEFNEEANMV